MDFWQQSGSLVPSKLRYFWFKGLFQVTMNKSRNALDAFIDYHIVSTIWLSFKEWHPLLLLFFDVYRTKQSRFKADHLEINTSSVLEIASITNQLISLLLLYKPRVSGIQVSLLHHLSCLLTVITRTSCFQSWIFKGF